MQGRKEARSKDSQAFHPLTWKILSSVRRIIRSLNGWASEHFDICLPNKDKKTYNRRRSGEAPPSIYATPKETPEPGSNPGTKVCIHQRRRKRLHVVQHQVPSGSKAAITSGRAPQVAPEDNIRFFPCSWHFSVVFCYDLRNDVTNANFWILNLSSARVAPIPTAKKQIQAMRPTFSSNDGELVVGLQNCVGKSEEHDLTNPGYIEYLCWYR